MGGATRRKEEGVLVERDVEGRRMGLAFCSGVGAAETVASLAVSSAVWKKGSGRHTWAARESMGRPGKEGARPGPRATVPIFSLKGSGTSCQ
jgi:hypothetical protein